MSTADARDLRRRVPLRRVLIATHAGIAALFAIGAMVSVVVIDQAHHRNTIRFGATRDAETLAAAVAIGWDRPSTIAAAIDNQTSIRDSVAVVAGTRSRNRTPSPVQSSGRSIATRTQTVAATAGLRGRAGAQLGVGHGKDVVTAWAPVRRGGRVIGSVVLVEPVDPGLPHVAGLLVLGVLGIVAVAAAGVVGSLVARRLAAPIEQLTNDIYHRAVGSETPRPTRGRLVREVAMLATTLESALTRLQRSSHNALRRADRRRTLVQQVSHNLRTPVSVIDLRVQQLELVESGVTELRGAEVAAERTRILAKLREHIAVLNRQIDEVIEATRAGPTDERPELVDLARIAAERLRLIGPIAEHRKLAFQRDLADGTLVEAPRAAVEAVIDELLTNAVKFTPVRSTVRVSVAVDAASSTAVLAVGDSGPGIPADERSDVVKEGVRGRDAPPQTGTGLGLYLVSEIVAGSDGSLHLRDAAEGGVEVRVILPLAQADRGEVTESPQASDEPGIDDEPRGSRALADDRDARASGGAR